MCRQNHPISLLGKALQRNVSGVSTFPVISPEQYWVKRTPCVPVGVLVVSGAISGYWHLPWSVLSSMSLKWDITSNVFVLVVECWTEEISAGPEEGAQEDHHCVCEGGCAPEEGRERLEAEPEEGEPNRGPRKCQNPGESVSRSEDAAAAPDNGNLPSLLYQTVKKGNKFQLEYQLSPTLMVFLVCLFLTWF